MSEETKIFDSENDDSIDDSCIEAEPDVPASEPKKDFKVPKRRKRSKKSLITAIVFVILGAAAAFGIYFLFFKGEDRIPITDKTVYGALDRSISGSGTTTPAETLSITPVSRAEIKEVFVKAGDMVEKGDLLYTQDDSEIDDQIAAVEEEIEGYEDQINEYNSSIYDTYTNMNDTYEKISDYNDQIKELRSTMKDMTVKAEFSGKITDVSAKEGRNVSNGAALATLTDDSVLEVSLYYSYSYQSSVYVGMPAEVSVSGVLGNLSGRVSDISYVSWTSNEGMRCFKVTVEVDNPGALTENSSASCILTARDGSKIYPVDAGNLSYKNVETVTAPAAGEILSVKVENFDSVYKGQVLFELDTEDVEKQIENLQKQITSANKQITNYNSQIENYRKKITSAEEKITDAYEKIEELEESRSDFAMRSEISGKVMYVNIEAGDTPNTMMTAITVYNLETMNISVNFDELDVDYVREGTEVTVTRTSAERNYFYRGVVTYLSPEATSSSGVSTFAATIEIYSRGELSSGVSVTYTVSLGDSEEGVLAPISALKSHEDKYYLYVKADRRPDNAVELENPTTEIPKGFYAVPVEVGSSNSQYIRILSGVSEDTEVFTRYRQNAPGNSGASNMGNNEEMSFENMFGQGGMPGFGGMQGGMPNFGGMQGGSSSRPSGGGSSNRPQGNMSGGMSGAMPGGR